MAVLKKIKSATLVEALVATVLIVIVLVIASLVLNNLVLNTFSKNTHPVETRLNELEYQIQNQLIQVPYEENFNGWNIVIQKQRMKAEECVLISATNEPNTKTLTRQRIYVEK